MGEVRGGLERPAEFDCLIKEEVWAMMSEENRRRLIGVLDRTNAKTTKFPDVLPNESHFAPAPPGCNFKAMMPGEGYWDLVREQKEELARQAREELARQEREELARQERLELAFQQREAMLVQAHDSADAGASPNASGLDQKRKAVETEKFPDVIRNESHFAPAPPGRSFKAMLPGEGYWELVREQNEEFAREAREQLARQEREELARQERVELAFQQREAMLVQVHDSADAGASLINASGRGQKRKAVEPEIDLS